MAIFVQNHFYKNRQHPIDEEQTNDFKGAAG